MTGRGNLFLLKMVFLGQREHDEETETSKEQAISNNNNNLLLCLGRGELCARNPV